MLTEPIPLPDIWAVLESFEDFQAWYPKHVLDQQSIDAALEKLQKHGIHSHFFGDIGPDDISVLGTDSGVRHLASDFGDFRCDCAEKSSA